MTLNHEANNQTFIYCHNHDKQTHLLETFSTFNLEAILALKLVTYQSCNKDTLKWIPLNFFIFLYII